MPPSLFSAVVDPPSILDPPSTQRPFHCTAPLSSALSPYSPLSPSRSTRPFHPHGPRPAPHLQAHVPKERLRVPLHGPAPHAIVVLEQVGRRPAPAALPPVQRLCACVFRRAVLRGRCRRSGGHGRGRGGRGGGRRGLVLGAFCCCSSSRCARLACFWLGRGRLPAAAHGGRGRDGMRRRGAREEGGKGLRPSGTRRQVETTNNQTKGGNVRKKGSRQVRHCAASSRRERGCQPQRKASRRPPTKTGSDLSGGRRRVSNSSQDPAKFQDPAAAALVVAFHFGAPSFVSLFFSSSLLLSLSLS